MPKGPVGYQWQGRHVDQAANKWSELEYTKCGIVHCKYLAEMMLAGVPTRTCDLYQPLGLISSLPAPLLPSHLPPWLPPLPATNIKKQKGESVGVGRVVACGLVAGRGIYSG